MYQPLGETFGFLDSLIVTLLSIFLIFVVIAIIIFVSSIFSKVIVSVDNKKNINPRPENKLLEEDEDAVVALLVATIDYQKETKKDARLVKISLIEEE